MGKIINTEWRPGQGLLLTRLSGLLNSEDILKWERSLEEQVRLVPADSSFKMLVDLHGFKAENFEVHKQYRTVMPLFLGRFAYRIGYLDMFPEAELTLQSERGIRCSAMANVHQDETKMKQYEEKFSKDHERYFTDSQMAMEWILSV